jgi:hypothetical protein
MAQWIEETFIKARRKVVVEGENKAGYARLTNNNKFGPFKAIVIDSHLPIVKVLTCQ